MTLCWLEIKQPVELLVMIFVDAYAAHQLPSTSFLTQSELIEPVSPQAAQLGNHFFFHFNQLKMHILEGPDKGHSNGEGK